MKFKVGDIIVFKHEKQCGTILKIVNGKLLVKNSDGFEEIVSSNDIILYDENTDKVTAYGIDFDIKDEGKWGKDDNEQIVSQAIDTVKQNTFSQIQKWTQLHPQYTIQAHPHSDDYINMVKNSIGGYDETFNKNVRERTR